MRGGGPRHYLNLYKKVNLPNLITIKGNVAKEITGKSYEELLAEAKNSVLKHSFSTKVSFNLLKQTNTVSSVAKSCRNFAHFESRAGDGKDSTRQ